EEKTLRRGAPLHQRRLEALRQGRSQLSFMAGMRLGKLRHIGRDRLGIEESGQAAGGMLGSDQHRGSGIAERLAPVTRSQAKLDGFHLPRWLTPASMRPTRFLRISSCPERETIISTLTCRDAGAQTSRP